MPAAADVGGCGLGAVGLADDGGITGVCCSAAFLPYRNETAFGERSKQNCALVLFIRHTQKFIFP